METVLWELRIQPRSDSDMSQLVNRVGFSPLP